MGPAGGAGGGDVITGVVVSVEVETESTLEQAVTGTEEIAEDSASSEDRPGAAEECSVAEMSVAQADCCSSC
jgi:hypothetical protein